MTRIQYKGELTRRGFFEHAVGALATAGILAGSVDATDVLPARGFSSAIQ